MAQVLVRQLLPEVVEQLKRRATARGASLEAFMREVLTAAAAEDRPSALARLDALRAAQPEQVSDSTDLVRARREGAAE
jgi:plasmid stability protein